MSTENGQALAEDQVRELIHDWARALRAKDLDGVMPSYAADVVTFDLAPPLRYSGADALKRSLEAWFRSFRGPVGFEISDLRIAAGDDVAFCRSLNRISGARTNGDETDVWVRATAGFRKVDGKWMIAHEHSSVPFYMDGSDRAAVDLKP